MHGHDELDVSQISGLCKALIQGDVVLGKTSVVIGSLNEVAKRAGEEVASARAINRQLAIIG